MKLRFGIDAAMFERVHATLNARCAEPPASRRVSDVYLDTPDDELATHGVTLRYRRQVALDEAGPASPRSPALRTSWRRQELWDGNDHRSLAKLGIGHLKQRLDASFAVRFQRWTWRLGDGCLEDGRLGDGWARVSLERGEITTGPAWQSFTELRITCRRRHEDAATRLAVELGATRVAMTKVRERGRELLGTPASHAASPG